LGGWSNIKIGRKYAEPWIWKDAWTWMRMLWLNLSGSRWSLDERSPLLKVHQWRRWKWLCWLLANMSHHTMPTRSGHMLKGKKHQKYLKNSHKWDDEPWISIDLQALKSAFLTLHLIKQVSCSKRIHGWLNTGEQKSKISPLVKLARDTRAPSKQTQKCLQMEVWPTQVQELFVKCISDQSDISAVPTTGSWRTWAYWMGRGSGRKFTF